MSTQGTPRVQPAPRPNRFPGAPSTASDWSYPSVSDSPVPAGPVTLTRGTDIWNAPVRWSIDPPTPPPIANAFDTGPEVAPLGPAAASAGAAPAAWIMAATSATDTSAPTQRRTAWQLNGRRARR